MDQEAASPGAKELKEDLSGSILVGIEVRGGTSIRITYHFG